MKKLNNSETKTVLLFLLLCVVVFVVLSVIALTSLDPNSSRFLDSQEGNQLVDNDHNQDSDTNDITISTLNEESRDVSIRDRAEHFVPLTSDLVAERDGKLRFTVWKGSASSTHKLTVFVNNINRGTFDNVSTSNSNSGPHVVATDISVKGGDKIDIEFESNLGGYPPYKRLYSQILQDTRSNPTKMTRLSKPYVLNNKTFCGGLGNSAETDTKIDITDWIGGSANSLIGFFCFESLPGTANQVDWDHNDMLLRIDFSESVVVTEDPPPNTCVLKPENYISTGFRKIGIKGAHSETFVPPTITGNQRIIGFNIIMHDNTGPFYYRPTIRLRDGQTLGLNAVTNPCQSQTDKHVKDGDFPLGNADVCTKNENHPITGRTNSHELKLKDENFSINNVTMDFNFWGDNDDDEYLDILDVQWVITDCAPATSDIKCVGFNIYNNQDVSPNIMPGSSASAAPQKNPNDTITVRTISENPIGLKRNAICWAADKMDSNFYKNPVVWECDTLCGDRTTDPNTKGVCVSNVNGRLQGHITDTISGFINRLSDHNSRNEAMTKGLVFITKIDNNDNGYCTTNPGYPPNGGYVSPGGTQPDTNNKCTIATSGQACIRRISLGSTPPPTITPTDPNACEIKLSNYKSEVINKTIGSAGAHSFQPPAITATQRVVGLNIVMHDDGSNWAYNPTITLKDGSVIKKSGITTPCVEATNKNVVPRLGADWIDICTGNPHPVTGKENSHELKLKDLNQSIETVKIEFKEFKEVDDSIKIIEIEWIIADCNPDGSSGELGECKVVPSVINNATSIKSGEKRISAVDKYKLSWTKPEINNTECSFVNTEVYFTQRDASGACNYPANPIMTVNDINQTELEINDFAKYGNYLLNWDKDYCWKVKNNVQKLKTIEVVSNSQVRMRALDAGQTAAALIPSYLNNPGSTIDQSAPWVNARPVYDNNWAICTVASQTWRPSGGDPNVPPNCYNVNSFIFMNPNGDENIFPRIIQSGINATNATRPAYARDVFRKNFTIPQNAVVSKLTLYSASDSVASYWINNQGVNNQTGSLVNNNVCGSTTNAGSYRGIHKLDLDPKFVRTGTNLLSGVITNADECNTNSPMGVQFILKADYADLADAASKTPYESQNFTFSTNKYPQFIRNGVTFDQNFNKSIAIEGNIPLGTVKCSFNNGCSIYPSATAPVCFSGNQNSGKADNPTTFWFEYRDPDNDSTINENFKHTFILSRASDKITNFSAALSAGDVNGIMYEHERDLIVEFDTNSGTIISRKGQQSGPIEITAGKFEDPTTKAIRIYYTIKFNEGFQTDVYNVYGLFESVVTGKAIALADNMHPNLINGRPDNWAAAKQVTQRGAWGVDLEVPVVEPPELIVSGINEFGVNWKVQESGQIGDVTMGCYTKAQSIPLQYVSPRSANISVTGKQANPTQCVVDDDKADFIRLLSDGNAANNQYNTRYLINEYKKFGDLGTIISATDRACNVSEPKTTEATKVQDNWISTRQGTTYIDDGMKADRVIDQLGDPKQEKTYFTYDFSGNQKKLYEKASDDLINLSTNFLGVNGGQLRNNTSLIREEISGFDDINEVPLIPELPSDIDSWFGYFEYVQTQKSRKVVNSPSVTVNDISKLPCGVNEACVYSGLHLTATNGKTLCDTKKVIFVKGNLIIEDELLNKDDTSACLFVVDGNMEVRNSKPVKDRNDILISPYDVIEGYFIVSGKVTFNQDMDVPPGVKGFGDGLFVRGGIVANQFENKRNLGIRNTIQSPALMVYDPRYIYILRDEIAARIISVRETDFNSTQP